MQLVFVILASFLILIAAKPRASPQEEIIIVEGDPANIEIMPDAGELDVLPDDSLLLEAIPQESFGDFIVRK